MELLNLNTLGTSLTQQNKLAEARRAKEMESTVRAAELTQTARQKTAVVNEQSMAAAAKVRESQMEILGGVDEQVQMAQRAIALSDSDNPLDRLELWTLQQTNKGYTREGNLDRLGYLQAASQALGAQGVLQQQAYGDMMTQIQSDLEMALATDQDQLAILALTEKQGQERIDAMAQYNDMRMGLLQQNQAMQELALSNMDMGQVETALVSAQNSESGTVNIGGIEMTKAMIEARKQSLTERTYQGQMAAANYKDLLLSDMDMPQLTEALATAQAGEGFITVQGQQISSARIQDALMARTNKDVQLQQSTRSLLLQSQERYIATLTPTEINTAIQNGGMHPGYPGQLDLPMLESTRDLKMRANQQDIESLMIRQQATDPSSMIVQQQGYLDGLQSNLPVGSPMSQLIENERSLMRTAAMLVDSGDPQRQASAIQAMGASRQRMQEAIVAEANRLGGGNKLRSEAWTYKLQGQPIPERVIHEALVESKGNPSIDWLEPATNLAYKTAYQQAMAGYNADFQNKMSNQEKIVAATDAAMLMVKQQIAGNFTTEIMGMQFQPLPGQPQNPLVAAGLGEREFVDMVRLADERGAAVYAQNTGADAEKMQQLMTGQAADPQLAVIQTSQLLLELDKRSPGLSQKYMAWWDSGAREALGAKYVEIKNQQVGQSFSRASEMALALPGVQDDMGTYASLLQGAFRQNYQAELERQHNDFVTFGGDPIAKQVFLLGIDSNMNDLQRQAAMRDIILPLTREGHAMGLNGNELQSFIDTQLQTRRWETPAQKASAQLILKNRASTLSTADKFMSSQQLWNKSMVFAPFAESLVNTLQGGDVIQRQVRGFEWWSAIAPKQ